MNQLYKGIFWIKGTENVADSAICVRAQCDSGGNITDAPGLFLSSKSGQTFNHENTWKRLSKTDTCGQKYNYYPRGRVEIKNGKVVIYFNPNIPAEELKKWCIDKFHLTSDNGIKSVTMKADYSKHYQCCLDE